jgi:uncharacterized repeat protein (TIGR03943 family)
VNTRTQSFLLLLFGGALLRISTGDLLLRYVRPVARPWVLLAGAGIVALALWSIGSSMRGSRGAGDDHDEDGDVDAHGHHAVSRAGWLVLAPVIALLVIAPPALGTFSASRVPVSLAKPPDIHFPALTGPSPVSLNLIDFATRALWDAGRTLTKREVSMTGFVLHSYQGGFLLSRLVITCCAADARPIDVGVQAAVPAPPPGTWVTVVGTYSGVSPDDATLPELADATMRVVPQPANPYDD